MPREWFEIARNPLERCRRDAFADPLEGEEWRGLRWAVPLMSWVAEGHVVPQRRGQVARVAGGRRVAKA